MARTVRQQKTGNPRIHQPTKRGRKVEVRRTRQATRRDLDRYR